MNSDMDAYINMNAFHLEVVQAMKDDAIMVNAGERKLRMNSKNVYAYLIGWHLKGHLSWQETFENMRSVAVQVALREI